MESKNKAVHARQLHDEAIVVTSHDHMVEYEDLLSMRDGGVTAKVTMLQTDVLAWDEEGPRSALESIYGYEGWARRALSKIERMLRVIEAHSDRFLVVRCVDDLFKAKSTDRSGIIFGFEGARPLEGKIELLQAYYRLGLRHLQLTWSFGNRLCDRVSAPAGEITWDNYRGTKTPGLTDFGREVIREANQLGVVLDPGHATDQTFFELLDLSTKPVVIGHASCSQAGKMAGDIDDGKLRALARNEGVLCIHFFAHYLRDKGATIDDLVDHILHVGSIAGIDHVGLGPDWLPLTTEYLRIHDKFAGLPTDQPRSADRPLGPLADLGDIAQLPRLTERLVQRGFSDDDILKVLGGNLVRVYSQVWG